MQKQPCVYLMSNKPDGVLYCGVTSDLARRSFEHKQACVEGFTKKYRLKLLVWYEVHESMYAAITREKAIKHWRRRWKIELIESVNPQWRDLYEDLA